MTTKAPRLYQIEARTAVKCGLADGWLRQVILLPTGTGKTFIMPMIAAEHDFSTGKIVIIMHRYELLMQTIQTFTEMFPERTVGLVQATTHQVDADIIVASVQTLGLSALKRASLGKVGHLFVDECHHAAAETYQRVIRDCGGFDSTPVTGFTATLVRSDKLGLGDTWQRVAYTKSIEWAENEGIIVRHHTMPIEIPNLNVADIAITPSADALEDGVDYSAEGLGKAMVNANAGPVLAAAYKRLAGKRQGIVFTPTITAARHVLDAFNAAGIRSALIIGDIKSADREVIYEDVRAHLVQVIVNVGVGTEGFDMPQLEVCVPKMTKSKSLLIQMVGRVKRTSPETGKVDALVLDPVGVMRTIPIKTIASLAKTGVLPDIHVSRAGRPKQPPRRGLPPIPKPTVKPRTTVKRTAHRLPAMPRGVEPATYDINVDSETCIVVVWRVTKTERVKVRALRAKSVDDAVTAGKKIVDLDRLLRSQKKE